MTPKGTMKTYIRFIHRISPCPTDVQGPYDEFPASLDEGRAFIHKHTGSKPPLSRARPLDDEDNVGWVYFPKDKPGNWWSISILRVPEDELPEGLRNG